MQLIIPSSQLEAMAILRGKGKLRGTVKLYSVPGGSLVAAEVTGLPENDSGFFALHFHEGESCTGEDFGDTLGHYNPGNKPHPHHAGDLLPLLNMGGRAFLAVETDRFFVEEVVGRTAVVHNGADDFRTQPAGDSGEKIACGVIHWI